MRLQHRNLLPLFVSMILLVTDQWLKHWVEHTLPLLKRFPIFHQQWLVLARSHNWGLMGDLFSTIPKGYIEPYTLYFPALCLLGFMIIFALRYQNANAFEKIVSFGFIASGFSNLWDELRQSYVVDTLQLYLGNDIYLPFNMADLGIALCAACLVFILVRELWSPYSSKSEVEV